MLSVIEQFNPDTTLDRAPRWLTRPEQLKWKQATSMVLSIVGRHNSNDALRGPLLFGRCLRVTTYFRFDNTTQCTKYLQYGQHPTRFEPTARCAICVGQHLTHPHTCRHPECKIKGTLWLHISMLCAYCGPTYHTGNSKECPTYTSLKTTNITGRGNQMNVDATAS